MADLEQSTRGGTEGPLPPGAATITAERTVAEGYSDTVTVESITQWKLFRRKFLRHKAAMVSLFVLTILVGASLLADYVAPYGFEEIDLLNTASPPTLADNHFFGTDLIGRDYFSRVLYGIRTSVRVAALVAVLSTAIGTSIGAIAGYFGGRVDNLLMRFTDLLLTLPGLAVLLVAASLLGQGSPFRVGLILSALFWTSLARIVRGTFLSLREKEFVEAAKASGVRNIRIIFRHMIPNALGPIIVNATLVVATAILVEATLSYLGFGIQPPNPALGKLISDGQGSMTTDWWLVTFPGITIVVICLCINFLGDGLRDALDPTQQKG